MGALTTIAPKLALLIPRLASDHDGEVIATVAAIRRTLGGAGADLHDLAGAVAAIAAPPLPTKDHAKELADVAAELLRQDNVTPWEASFLQGLVRQLHRGRPASPKQAECLWGIYRQRAAT